MFKKILILILLTLQGFLAFSQDFKLPKGIYKNLESFKSGQPDFDLNYAITKEKYEWKGGFSKKFVFSYKLNLSKKESKKIGHIFGFSDGINFYKLISDGFWPESRYVLMEKLNNLYVYENAVNTHISYSNHPLSGSIVLFAITIIEDKTFSHVFIKKGVLKKLLKKHAPLYFEQFKKAKFSENEMLFYFKEFIKLSVDEHWKLAKKYGVVSSKLPK